MTSRIQTSNCCSFVISNIFSSEISAGGRDGRPARIPLSLGRAKKAQKTRQDKIAVDSAQKLRLKWLNEYLYIIYYFIKCTGGKDTSELRLSQWVSIRELLSHTQKPAELQGRVLVFDKECCVNRQLPTDHTSHAEYT